MKKTSKIILAGVLAVSVTGTAVAFGAYQHFAGMSMQDKAEMMSNRLERKLDLTEVQKDKLLQLTQRAATIMDQVKQQDPSRSEWIAQLLDDETLDQTALLSRINQKTALVNDNAPEMVGLMAEFVDSLNAEQKAEIKSMINQRGMMHRGGGHRFGGSNGQHKMFNN